MPAQHIICTVRAQTEHRDKVKSLLLELVGPAMAEEGCLYYDINQQNDEPDTFHIVDGWVSAEAVEAHVAHPNVRRVVAELTPLLSQPLELRTSTRISE
jgi:quinol monooxygenase YgiN